MEKDIEQPADNIRTTAKWRIGEETIQRVAEAGHEQPGNEASHKVLTKRRKSSKDTVLTTQIDTTVWTRVRLTAQEIARAALGYSGEDDSKKIQDAINSYANSLIVVEDNRSVVVYNTPEQASEAKKQAKQQTQDTQASAE